MSAAHTTSRPLGLFDVLRKALGFWRPHWRGGLLLLGLMALPQLYKAFFAYSQRLIVDRVLAERDATLLGWILLGLGVGFLFAAAASLTAEYVGARIGAEIVNRIRERLFDHLQRLGLGFYHRSRSGDVVARFTSDLNDIEKSLTDRIADAAFSLLGLAVTLPVLFSLEWRLALVALFAFPVATLGTRLFAPSAAAARYQLKNQEAALAATVQESVLAQPVVKVFGLAAWLRDAFHRRLETLRGTFVRARFLANLVGASSSLGILAGQVLVIAGGAWLAFRGELTAGTLVAFVSLHALASKDAYDLTKKVIPSLIASSGGLRRIEELLAEPIELAEVPGASELGTVRGPIVFEEVGFGYSPERRELHRVSFAIGPGERVALVGPSGSGKSTLLALLLRFYDPTTGRITVDGADLREISLASWYRQVGVVFQESVLFDVSVRENIALGRLGASDSELRAAASAAELLETIEALPAGWDTPVGEVGGRLSGGQRQRIAIARAFLRDPAVLVLDEATSALDPGSAAALDATLERLARGRIVVSVTHRLEAARRADRILVLAGGELVEQGHHDELLAERGLYWRLWEQERGLGPASSRGVAAERLSRIPHLADLSSPRREEIAARLRPEGLAAGRVAVAEGERGRELFFVEEGRLEVLLGGEPLAVLGAGETFGETALLENVAHTATVRALEPCRLLVLDRIDGERLLHELPALRESLAATAEQRAGEREAFGRRSASLAIPFAAVERAPASGDDGPGD